MTLESDEQTRNWISRTALGLQASSLLVHLLCCGLPLVVGFAALGGLAGMAVLPFGFEQWFHRYELPIFFLAVVMVLVSGVLQFISHRHANQTHHEHHDCDKKGHSFQAHEQGLKQGHGHESNPGDPAAGSSPAAKPLTSAVSGCDHEEDCEKRANTGRWLLGASVLMLGLNAFLTFGLPHAH